MALLAPVEEAFDAGWLTLDAFCWAKACIWSRVRAHQPTNRMRSYFIAVALSDRRICTRTGL